METQTPTPQQNPSTPSTPQETPQVHHSTAIWYVLLAIVIIAGAYAYYALRTPATTSDTSTDTSMSTETTDASSDPVAQQLQAVSTANDSATIKQELSATDLTDVDTEMSSVTSETNGL